MVRSMAKNEPNLYPPDEELLSRLTVAWSVAFSTATVQAMNREWDDAVRETACIAAASISLAAALHKRCEALEERAKELDGLSLERRVRELETEVRRLKEPRW